MVEISLSGSGEGPGWGTAPGYSTTPNLPSGAGIGGWRNHRELREGSGSAQPIDGC